MTTSLKAIFGLDATGLKTELKQIGAQIRSTANLWGKFGAAAGLAAFGALARDAINLGSRISDLAEQLRIGTDELQTLTAVATKAGVSQQDIERAIRNANIRTQQALDGNTQYADALERLGLNVQKFAALESDKKLEQIAIAYARAGKSQQAYTDVARVLGEKAGPKMLEVLRRLNDEGLADLIKQSKEAGLVMEASVINTLDLAADEIAKFKDRITIAVGNIIVNFRTEEGIKLLGAQLLGAAATFAAKIVDAVTYPSRIVLAVFGAAFDSVAANFRNGLLEVVKLIATQLNRVLPKKFELNIAGLEALKATGTDVADAITRAIADTDPAALTTATRAGWDEIIAKQQAIVDGMEKKVVKPLTAPNSPLAALPGALRDAASKLADAAAALAESRRDFFAATLDELRAGTRGTASQQVAAREIQRLEDQARRLFDSGAIIEGRDQSGNRTTRDFNFYQQRALEARKELSNLRSSEREPFRKMEDAVVKSETHLKELNQKLTPAEIN